MTDAEIVRAVTEKVMGWTRVGHLVNYKHDTDTFSVASETGQVWWPKVFDGWNPLERDSDACQVLDKMAEDGWIVVLQCDKEGTNGGCWLCCISSQDASVSRFEGFSPSRRRAICLSSLQALGVDVGEQEKP